MFEAIVSVILLDGGMITVPGQQYMTYETCMDMTMRAIRMFMMDISTTDLANVVSFATAECYPVVAEEGKPL